MTYETSLDDFPIQQRKLGDEKGQETGPVHRIEFPFLFGSVHFELFNKSDSIPELYPRRRPVTTGISNLAGTDS